ncbi:DUF3800 domain-containing protein [Paracoccus pantotrophus]|uniref:DUF3800 domain-containing protein n=1 Tax=Paracoccus pantotrophus TaxID=82367 RepID=UPI003B969689
MEEKSRGRSRPPTHPTRAPKRTPNPNGTETALTEFRRVVAGERDWGWVNRNFGDVDFQPIFSKKSENSVGLQLADLTARPIAINVLRPQQANRAFDIIAPKIRNRKTFP